MQSPELGPIGLERRWIGNAGNSASPARNSNIQGLGSSRDLEKQPIGRGQLIRKPRKAEI